MSTAPAPSEPPAPSEGVDARAALLGAAGLTPVSPRLVPARYIAGLPGYAFGALLIVGAIAGAVLSGWSWLALLGLVPLAIMAQGLLLTPRRVRAIGYHVGEEDLTVASGIMFRSVETIPYGRIQSVKIDEGPVARRYGLATLTISTAHDTSVTLPGLPRDEAEHLRALLAERGIDLMAAL